MKAFLSLCAAAVAMTLSASEAPALTVSKVRVAAADGIVKVYHRGHRHARGGNGLFSNWCAYNCYRVSPCASGECLGAYHYSHYLYDQDLPFPYRWDWDANAVDNVLGYIHPYTGDPFLRLFERTY